MTLLTVIFVLFFWIDVVTSLDDAICPTLYDNRYNITWPSTSDYTISDPPCVDQTKKFVIRRCNKGHWDSEPKCFYVQTKNLPQCPEGFIESEELDICYQLLEEKTSFPPKCPYQDVLPFNYYKSAIKDIDNVWMPVKRESWDYMRWIEASSLYKTKFTDDYLVSTDFQTVMNCLVYNFSHSTAFADYCSSQHHSLCVYKKFTQLGNRVCGSEEVCYQSDFSTSFKCFCLGDDQDFHNKAEFLQPFQNKICMELTNETCAIGLEKNENGNYVWANSEKEINYTLWSTDVIFDDSHRFGACKPQGWVLTEKPVSCFWYEKTVEMLEPELILLYDNTSLILNITNPQSLHWFDSNSPVYCFTNADRDLLYRYSNFTMKFNDNNSIVYEFLPLNYGPGHYWCEAFRIVDLATPLRSNTIFLRQAEKFRSEFVMKLIFYNFGGNNDLTDYVYSTLIDEIFINEINSSFVFRSMNVSYAEDASCALVNLHFTSQVVLVTFETAKQFIYQSIIDKVLGDVLSGDFCFEHKSEKLTWPRTLIDNTAVSKELCFKADNTRFTKSCQGNFIDGGQWLQVEEDCEIPEYSNVTDELLAVTNFSQLSLLILNKYSYLYAVDLYVIYEFLKGFDASSFTLCNDACHLSVTLDYLQRVNRSVLEESQQKYKAIFHILYQTNRLFNNLNSTNISDCLQEPCEENNYNFYLMVASLHDLPGIYIPDKKSHLAPILEKNATTEHMKAIGQDAVWLSERFIEGANVEIKLIFTTFFENSFFPDVASTVVLGPVFGLVFSNFNVTFQGPIQMLQKIKNATAADCAVWNWNENKWEKVDNAVKTGQFFYCEFWQLGYFAVIYSSDSYNTDGNVTECLTQILNSNKTTAEVISNLHEVSKRYDEFVPVDIALVGEILEKVNEDKKIDLRILAETVSNLHEIKKEIMFHSQQHKKATDTILYYIDRIIQNQEYKKSVEIVSDNFMIFICDLKASNFSGVALVDSANLSQTQILKGDLEADDVARDNNITCAILLSTHLKNQFKEDTKVIVTVYMSDAFFNQKNSKVKYVSRVFGIILPEIQHYEGPVSILHNIDPENYQEQCSFWQYNQTLSGFWSKDLDPVTYESSAIRCSFWHTTHFALLLVDQEKVSHDPVLDWITNVTWSVSFLGLFCIVLTGVLFKKWRESSGNQILLSFTFSNILETVIFYVSGNLYHNSKDHVLCTIIGAVLHYLVISQFCWMLVIGYLQYRRFVNVLGKQPTRIVLKSSLCGWGLPLFPVIGVLGLQNNNYLERTFRLCYPTGLGLYLGVWIPILVTTIINLILYGIIIYSIIFKKENCIHSGFKNKILEFRIAFLLFFMLGLTWIFGFLYEISDENFLEYVFTITASSQGFVLFLFFVVFNISTRQMYLQAFKRYCYKYH